MEIFSIGNTMRSEVKYGGVLKCLQRGNCFFLKSVSAALCPLILSFSFRWVCPMQSLLHRLHLIEQILLELSHVSLRGVLFLGCPSRILTSLAQGVITFCNSWRGSFKWQICRESADHKWSSWCLGSDKEFLEVSLYCVEDNRRVFKNRFQYFVSFDDVPIFQQGSFQQGQGQGKCHYN